MPDWRRVWRLSLLGCALLPCAAWACGSGVVFADANGDGARQPGERGLPGVRVSNGREIVSTDGDGAWRDLPAAASGVVFVIKPAGFAVATGGDGLPAFWRGPDPADCTFALRPDDRGAEGPLKVIVSSDPQAGTADEVAHYARIVDRMPAAHRDAGPGYCARSSLALSPRVRPSPSSRCAAGMRSTMRA